jgi:TIR domain/PDZ domain
MALENEPSASPSRPEQPGRVFLSYAAEDGEKVRRLGEYLRACGWQIWSDRHIPAGKAYDESIEEALRQSACVVVLWSRAAVNSRWVRSEASEGASRDILVPVMIEEVTIPLEFRLLQAVDLRSWDGSHDDVRLANVDEAIRRITNVGSTTPDVGLSAAAPGPARRAAGSIAVRVAAVLLLLVPLAGSIWWWDAFHREHTEYFANVTKRWGFPEGVGRLNAKQVAARNVSIAIVRRGHRALPHEIRFVNASGNAPAFGYHFSPLSAFDLNPLPRGGPEDPRNAESSQLSRVLFSRDEEGRILEQAGFSRGGKHLYTIRFAQPGLGQYKRAGFNAPVRHSGIEYLQISRVERGPHAGRDERVMFLDGKGRAQSDADGAFGYRVVLDDAGLATERINLDAEGKDAPNRVGILKETRWYDTFGNVVRTATVNAKGSPTPTPFGDAGSRFEYDAVGNVTRITFYDAHDQPVVPANVGLAGMERTYDAHGNLTSLAFFGPDRRLAPGPTGPAKVIVEWKGDNHSLGRFYDASGKPAPAGRIFQKQQTWNRIGLVVEETYLDDKGTITRADDGCATVRLGYDDNGNVDAVQCLDEHRSPTTSINGFSTLRSTHDEAGNLLLTTAFDVRGAASQLNDTYASLQRTYNEFGKLARETFLDARGKPIVNRTGCATLTHEYDTRGNEVALICLDAANQRAMHVQGYSAIRMKYDDGGLEVERAFVDTRDRPTTTFEGWSTLRYEHDQRGYLTRQACFDARGRPVKGVDGYASARVKRNAAGQVLEVAYFDESGRPIIASRLGAAVRRWAYDDAGRVAEVTTHDVKGGLIQNAQGFSTMRFSYDEYSREIGRAVFDVTGQKLDYRTVVDRVLPGSFAMEVGLRPGDVILTYDGEIVVNSHQFTNTLELFKGDRSRELRIARGTQILTLDVKPGRLTGLQLAERVSGKESPRHESLALAAPRVRR